MPLVSGEFRGLGTAGELGRMDGWTSLWCGRLDGSCADTRLIAHLQGYSLRQPGGGPHSATPKERQVR